MDEITVCVLTVSDRCAKGEARDSSGRNLEEMIRSGVIKNAVYAGGALVPDSVEDIQTVLRKWCREGINLVLTTGGTGLSERDVTPEATAALVDRTVPGISGLVLSRSLESTPLAALSRGIAGIRDKTLIVNLPGSEKGARECLEAVAPVVPHAVHLITGRVAEVERLHGSGKKSSVLARVGLGREETVQYPCVMLTSAQNTVLERIEVLRRVVEVKLRKATGHVLAEDITAKDFLPPADASLKDGYAVKYAGVTVTGELSVVGVSRMGKVGAPESEIRGDECMEVSTGAMIPPGADTVVQVEDVEIKNDGAVIVIRSGVSLHPGKDIRKKGFDFAPGQLVLRRGTKMNASCLGVAAAVGVSTVRVFAKPVVAIISTGDELASPEEENLEPGKVRDSNKITLMALIEEEGFEVIDCGTAADDPDSLRDAIEKAAKAADVIVTSGSMSMGRCDYLKDVLVADFHAEIIFWRIWMRPGKPAACGIFRFGKEVKFWFGLPGNPASAFVTTHLIVLPALRKAMNLSNVLPTRLLDVAVTDRGLYTEERPHYVRALLTTDGRTFKASVTGNQSSSRILSCVEANCLLEVEGTSSTPEGKKTEVTRANALLIGPIPPHTES